MGFLHRFYAAKAAAVWQTETRLLQRLRLARMPSAVPWISTSTCDLKCPHCYSHGGRKSDGELTTAEACELIVDELVKLGRPTFVIAGGEALLRKDLDEVVAYSAERDIEWAIHTRGGWARRKEALLRQHTPRMAAISLDGPREYHDRFRGKDGNFEAALDAVRILREAGCPEVVIGTTVNRQNADLLADMSAAVRDSGAHSWGLHLVTPEGRAGKNMDLIPTPDQLRRVAAFARRMRRVFSVEMDNEWGSAGSNDIYYRNSPFLCGAGRFTCVVSATGELMPCTTTDKAASQGNVRERALSEIWANEFCDFRTSTRTVAADGKDCWLQTRNNHSCRKPAFYDGVLDTVPASCGGCS